MPLLILEVARAMQGEWRDPTFNMVLGKMIAMGCYDLNNF